MLYLLFGPVLFSQGFDQFLAALREPMASAAERTVRFLLTPARGLYVTFVVGFLIQGALWQQAGAAVSRRLLTSISLFFLVLLPVDAALLLYRHLFQDQAPAALVLAGSLGLAAGFGAWWLAHSLLNSLSRRRAGHLDPARLWSWLPIALAGAIALVPLHLDPGAGDWSLSSYPVLVQKQLYYLIKGVILWVPVGFLYALAGYPAALQRWVLAGVAAFFVVAAPFLAQFEVRELLEVLFAPIGVAVGTWIGLRSALATDAADRAVPTAPETASSTSPAVEATPPAARGSHRWSRARLLRTGLAALPLALAAWGVWAFPRWQLALGLGLAGYALLLLRFRYAWLLLLPALIPALDLAPWSGRFFGDESDLLWLITCAGALYHGVHRDSAPLMPRALAVLGGLFALLWLIALVRGLLPLDPLDLNAFNNYYSHYNSLRVGKAFFWALVLAAMLRWTLARESNPIERLAVPGILLGLLAVVLIGVRERWQFADLLDFSVPYRITASFSSMHTGGAHLPGFLALAIPFVWYWTVRGDGLWRTLAGLALFAAAVYLVISTVTRASFLALLVELALLGLFWWRTRRSGPRRQALRLVIGATAMVLVAGGILYVGVEGAFFQKRLATVERDAGTRTRHWHDALETMDPGWATRLFGMGLGTFPETYFFRNPAGVVPGTCRYLREGGNVWVHLSAGKTLYLAQRVAIRAGQTYRLAFDVRSDASPVTLTTPVCEKHLLDSLRCRWLSHKIAGEAGVWHRQELSFNSGRIGEGNLFSRRPVELFLYNPNPAAALDVDNVRLSDSQGQPLLHNGDFSQGGDFWLFKTHDHLPWHIKNLWVSMLFEQGWLGLLAFNLFVLAVLVHLGEAAWRGNGLAGTVVAAIVGFLVLGLFASPFDAPRIAELFFLVLLLGLFGIPGAKPLRRGKHRHPRKPPNAHAAGILGRHRVDPVRRMQ